MFIVIFWVESFSKLKVTESAVCGRSYGGERGSQAAGRRLLGWWLHALGCHSGEEERRTDRKCVLEGELTELADGLDVVANERGEHRCCPLGLPDGYGLNSSSSPPPICFTPACPSLGSYHRDAFHRWGEAQGGEVTPSKSADTGRKFTFLENLLSLPRKPKYKHRISALQTEFFAIRWLWNQCSGWLLYH